MSRRYPLYNNHGRFDVMTGAAYKLLTRLREETYTDLYWAYEKVFYNVSEKIIGNRNELLCLFIVYHEKGSFKCAVYSAIHSYFIDYVNGEKMQPVIYKLMTVFDMGPNLSWVRRITRFVPGKKPRLSRKYRFNH
jgi:hypothetical protein